MPSARSCRDCHAEISRDVPDHAIAGHLEKMECAACHAAWAPQEYGTFLVRAGTERQRDAFAALPDAGPWKKSAALRRQDAPPLGLNARGKVAPIRPQFVLFATDAERGWENRLLAAECLSYAAVKRALERRPSAPQPPAALCAEGPQIRPITDYQSFWDDHARTHPDGDPDEHVYH